MTASQQPTGHDKAVEALVAAIGGHEDYCCAKGCAHHPDAPHTDCLVCSTAAKVRAHDRAALAAGDPHVAEALGLSVTEWTEVS